MALSLLATAAVGVPREARALDRDTRAVIVAGEYGLLAGTLLGLASLPLHQDARGVFIGSSVGLYLGIAVGIYYVLHRDDPQNPLKLGFAASERRPQARLLADAPAPLAGTTGKADARPAARLDVPVFRF